MKRQYANVILAFFQYKSNDTKNNFILTIKSFLDASTHLYKRLCPSVRWSVHCSVRLLVRPSVGPSIRGSIKRFSDIAEMRTLRQ